MSPPPFDLDAPDHQRIMTLGEITTELVAGLEHVPTAELAKCLVELRAVLVRHLAAGPACAQESRARREAERAWELEELAGSHDDLNQRRRDSEPA